MIIHSIILSSQTTCAWLPSRVWTPPREAASACSLWFPLGSEGSVHPWSPLTSLRPWTRKREQIPSLGGRHRTACKSKSANNGNSLWIFYLTTNWLSSCCKALISRMVASLIPSSSLFSGTFFSATTWKNWNYARIHFEACCHLARDLVPAFHNNAVGAFSNTSKNQIVLHPFWSTLFNIWTVICHRKICSRIWYASTS